MIIWKIHFETFKYKQVPDYMKYMGAWGRGDKVGKGVEFCRVQRGEIITITKI